MRAAVLASARALTAERDAERRTVQFTARELAAAMGADEDAVRRALVSLAKAGAVERTVRRTYDAVAVRWGFGGKVACVRRRAFYTVK